MIAGLLAIIALSVSFIGCAGPERAQSLDEKAQDIYESLMCPLCPGQTIAQSQSELSAQMRAIVRERLEQGETKEQILRFFVERYGEQVLAAPPPKGFNLIAWLGPFIGLAAGIVVIWFLVRKWARRGKKSPPAPVTPTPHGPHDERYRRQLEEDLKEFGDRGFR